jgi:spore coat protein A, manganese oxidase
LIPITRRRLLEGSALLAARLATRNGVLSQSLAKGAPPGFTTSTLDVDTLARYVDPLPIPEIARPSGSRLSPEDPKAKLPFYRLAMREIECQVHRDLPATRLWGFGTSSPGPTLETRSNQGLLVEWANELPSKHFLPIDHHLDGAGLDVPEVRSVIHLHGGRTPPESDGYPEHWYTSGKSATCHYPNRQNACMLFYHDHAMGINRLNIYAGLMGLYFVRDQAEDALNLPRGEYEVPLLVYDRFLHPDGQLAYPVSGKPDAPWVAEVFGNAILVNGKLFPHLDVEPRRYRFRLMNGSNGRFYRFSLGIGTGSIGTGGNGAGNRGLAFEQIGTEQGFLPAAVSASRVVMAPGERADLLFDFSTHAGETILLRSDALEIMAFRVASSPAATGATAAAAGSAPQPAPQPRTAATSVAGGVGGGSGAEMAPASAIALPSFARIGENQAVKTRRLTLDENLDLVNQSMGMLLNKTPWHMPVTENPALNSTEIWEFVNLTDDSHPIHLHLVRFQILDRRAFDTYEFQDKGTIRFVAPAVPPDPTEAGWKDTVRADPGVMTRIIIPFEGFQGRYVWHCHILEHEDNAMMRPYDVIAGG